MKGQRLAEIATGAVVIAVAAFFLVYAVVQGGRAAVGGGGLVLTATFDRVDGLSPGSEVRIGGVRVGQVTAMRINPETFLAEITLNIRADLRLPRDSSAEIQSESLMGGRYVAIVPGGDDAILANGGRITDTQGAISLESLLGRFIFSVTQMGGGAEAAPPR